MADNKLTPEIAKVKTAEQVLEEIKPDLNAVLAAVEAMKGWMPSDIVKKVDTLCYQVQKLNGRLRNHEKDIPDIVKLRELVAMAARATAVALHNVKNRTDLALRLMRVTSEEFSDLEGLKLTLLKDVSNLGTQLNVLVRNGRLTYVNSIKPSSAQELLKKGLEEIKVQNGSRAMNFLLEASYRECLQARLELGKMYMQGNCVPKSEVDAVRYFHQAAQEGSAEGMVQLSRCFENGWGVEKNENVSRLWLSLAVEQGDGDAANQMGMRYLKGSGVARDPAEAAKWIRKGALAGSADAMWNMGSMCETGLGTEKSIVNAATWYAKAADRGHPEAAFKAGLLYSGDNPLVADATRARKYFVMSAEGGSLPGCREAARMLSQGLGGNPDKAQALKLHKKAYELSSGDKNDALALGVAYLESKGVADLVEAKKYLLEARQKGVAEAEGYLQQVQAIQDQRALADKKLRQKKLRRTLISLAAVVILIFAGTLTCFFLGKSALGKGDYETAYNLLSIGRIYDQDAYRDAQFHRGVQLLNHFDFEGAYRLLEGSGRTDSQEYCYANGMHILMEKAGASEDVEAALELAAQNFEKAGDCGDASEYLEVLNRIEAGQISRAMELALELDPNQTGQLLLTDWSEILLRLELEDDARRELLIGCMDAWTQHRTDAPTKADADDVHGNSSTAMTGWSSYYVCEFSDFDAFMDDCGTAPAGKVLILRAYNGYKDDAPTYGVDLSFMEYLPARFYPGTLAEVEYVVVVEYDYQDSPTGDYGWGYGTTTQGLQEIGQVYVMNITSGRTIYESGVVIGPDSPQSFTYSGAAPTYKTGGSPDLGDEAYDALKKIPGLTD